jgi:hypothetical protein
MIGRSGKGAFKWANGMGVREGFGGAVRVSLKHDCLSCLSCFFKS